MEANLRAGERGVSESEIAALSERVAVLERIIVIEKRTWPTRLIALTEVRVLVARKNGRSQSEASDLAVTGQQFKYGHYQLDR